MNAAVQVVTYQDLDEAEKKQVNHMQEKYLRLLKEADHKPAFKIPFIQPMIDKVRKCNTLEALFFFYKTNDPEIDRHMLRAFMIRDYELKFHFYTSIGWFAASMMLPAFRKFKLSTTLTISSLFSVAAMYRGFRRGYDQIEYVGETYIEMHMRKMSMMKYFRDHKDYLPEFRQQLIDTGKFIPLLECYGLLQDDKK